MARTKILLTQDIPSLGQAGNVYTVAAGYARNYLLPRGLAVLATKGALKQADVIKEAALRRRAQERANASAQAEIIGKQRLLFTANAGDNERLYGSVTSADIAEKLATAAGFEVERRKILLDHPIRELGTFTIQARLMADIAPSFVVAVVREGEGWPEAEARAAAAVQQTADTETETA
jgi:large subunit ribosomal protein L9